ncbi:MAG: heavy-metal-associated domain-containing protein [Clostridia bacterium]|jgi:copper chaperone CopZ|nr:heavy-metal-associated domain-containing protein [Clostridia bacterium]
MKEIVLNVKGMMCGGCENRVKKSLEDIEGIESVKADHKTGKVVIMLNKFVLEETIKETLEDIGYEVI